MVTPTVEPESSERGSEGKEKAGEGVVSARHVVLAANGGIHSGLSAKLNRCVVGCSMYVGVLCGVGVYRSGP